MNVSNAGVFVDLQLSLAPAQHVLDCAEVSLFDAEIPFKLLSALCQCIATRNAKCFLFFFFFLENSAELAFGRSGKFGH